jgi:prophage antirepressor-like protein
MNKVSIFEHPEFGRIRTLEIDGKIWFCASDVAAALGYSNPRDAVVRHCKPMEVCQNAHLLFFKHKAPTFTSWGFVIT